MILCPLHESEMCHLFAQCGTWFGYTAHPQHMLWKIGFIVWKCCCISFCAWMDRSFFGLDPNCVADGNNRTGYCNVCPSRHIKWSCIKTHLCGSTLAKGFENLASLFEAQWLLTEDYACEHATSILFDCIGYQFVTNFKFPKIFSQKPLHHVFTFIFLHLFIMITPLIHYYCSRNAGLFFS